MAKQAQVKTFFDTKTFTYTHIVYDADRKIAAVVDSVLDYDPKSGRTSTSSADQVVSFIQENELKLDWILETHVHADHLSAAPYLKTKLGGQIGIGNQIPAVQKTFKSIFNAESAFKTDGSQFDVQFNENDIFKVGDLDVQVLHTPGHTPACVTYVVENDHAFVGDTIFMPDQGTARCDFPGGDAITLFHSVQKILSLPGSTKLYMCHDYGPNGREYQYMTTVKEERDRHIHVNATIDIADFVKMRTERDATLDMPTLILPSVQINMRAGEMPPVEANGTAYIKVPLNAL